MTKKIIKYKLTTDGKIPSYIDDGGYYPKPNNSDSPQDWTFIGATVDGSNETAEGELKTRSDVISYLLSYTSDSKERDETGKEVKFSQSKASSYIWSKRVE